MFESRLVSILLDFVTEAKEWRTWYVEYTLDHLRKICTYEKERKKEDILCKFEITFISGENKEDLI